MRDFRNIRYIIIRTYLLYHRQNFVQRMDDLALRKKKVPFGMAI